MLNNLEATIQKLIAEAAASMSTQIAHSVRQSLAAEIMGQGAPSAAAAMPKRRGRPPGTKNKPASAPAEKAGKKARRSFKRRIITPAELQAVLDVLAKKPGIGSIQIQKEAGIDAKQAARVLGKLREVGKVKWKGERSKATYTVA